MDGIEAGCGSRAKGFGNIGSRIESAEETMPDQTPNPESSPPAKLSATASSPSPAAQRGPTIRIGDEFGTAKRNLPPVKVLLLATAGVLMIAGIAAFLQRAKPQG